jgi:two-component system nitrate/nitrite response regulator NarL
MHSTTIVIADRHPVVLHGLRHVLGEQTEFRILASCGDGVSCVEAIRSLSPDIALLDASMPDVTGIEMLAIINSEKLATRLVFFASDIDERFLMMSGAAGAYGVILKDAATEVLVQALRGVARSKKPFMLVASDRVVSREQTVLTEKSLTVLTVRERQIMLLVSEGLSNKEIGRRLNIADGTIKVHLHHIFQKLDIGNRTVLAAFAMSHWADLIRDVPLG